MGERRRWPQVFVGIADDSDHSNGPQRLSGGIRETVYYWGAAIRTNAAYHGQAESTWLSEETGWQNRL
jgi:hypothetical protein